MYSAAVLERVRDPKRVGVLPDARGDVGTGESGSLDLGPMARIQVRVEGERIVEARFKVFGCSAAIAAAGLLTEWLEGATVADARSFSAAQVVAALELPGERQHVAQVVIEAAERALDDVTGKASEHDD